MNSFYIEGVGEIGASMELLQEDARHAHQVLRMRTGEEIYAVDALGNRFSAEIAAISKDGCTVELKEALADNEADVKITLYMGIPKADKLDFVAQKITELGASRLVPVKMERCVTKLDEKDGKKRQERLEKIAREAAKQCKRACAPEILPPMTWKQAAERMRAHDLLLVPWEDARGFGLLAAKNAVPDAKEIGIVIGPEGGMSAGEVNALTELGARTVTLGPRILRAETAAVTACAMAMLLWGDIG